MWYILDAVIHVRTFKDRNTCIHKNLYVYFIRVCSNYTSIYRSYSLTPEKRLKHSEKKENKEETKSVQALIFLAI